MCNLANFKNFVLIGILNQIEMQTVCIGFCLVNYLTITTNNGKKTGQTVLKFSRLFQIICDIGF